MVPTRGTEIYVAIRIFLACTSPKRTGAILAEVFRYQPYKSYITTGGCLFKKTPSRWIHVSWLMQRLSRGKAQGSLAG